MNIFEREAEFLTSDRVFGESDEIVRERWWWVLAHLPYTHGRHLWEIANDDLRQTYESGRLFEVAAALELCMLRQHFFTALYRAGIGRRHVNIWWLESNACWRNKFMHRLDAIDPSYREELESGDTQLNIAGDPPHTICGWLH